MRSYAFIVKGSQLRPAALPLSLVAAAFLDLIVREHPSSHVRSSDGLQMWTGPRDAHACVHGGLR